ncbi:uncharacterized protein [Rutidosis leptorrhynchoides]|uniref:uncharacterized protein n=1 Tax=Rutidosis leptorrhynchoides TaxID=125765 RepID=UPI003A9A595C
MGAIHEISERSSYGAIVRDDQGRLLGGLSVYLDVLLSPILTEVYAFRETMRWLLLQGYTSVILKMDCHNLVNVFHKTDNGINEISMLISECKMMALQFACFSLRWIRRQENMVAHILAQQL